MTPLDKRIYGLVGFPVSHSLSPEMHKAAFSYLGINAEYKLFPLKENELEDFFKNLSKNNIYGLNVTIPYKEKVLDFVRLDSESFYLTQIKAVNTIVRKDGALFGFNTDIPGFSRHLKENFDPADKKVAILGSGGAGRAVAYAIANSKAKKIAVYDIDKKRAQNLVEMIKNLFSGFDIQSMDNIEQLDISNKDLLINATPIGMKKEDPCLVKQELLHKNLFVYDLIYNPAQTKLLAEAQKAGAKTANGLGMLLYQGALSFGHFTGADAPIDIMRQALNEGVRKL